MESIINLLCGIGLFLCGIFMMSEHTENAFGERLKNALGILTKNRFTGMLTGLTVTGIIQSSSATTVMTVSFVATGLMSLSQAQGLSSHGLSDLCSVRTSVNPQHMFSTLSLCSFLFFGTLLC